MVGKIVDQLKKMMLGSRQFDKFSLSIHDKE